MIIIFSVTFILFLFWTYNVFKNKFDGLDKKIYEKIKINNLLTFIFKFITNLASTEYLIILTLLMLIFFDNKISALLFMVALIINSCLIGIIKNTFKRMRPNINRLVNEKGYSYPSGHTMSATSFYGLIIFFIVISSLILPIKVLLISLLVLLILLVGFSRIYLGVHYFSDVVGGLLMASSYILLYIYFVYFVLNIV